MFQHRFQVYILNFCILTFITVIWVLRNFVIHHFQTRIGLVAAFIDRRTAERCEPYRLHSWRPSGRRRRLLAARTIVVSVQPPVSKVLVSEDPWLAAHGCGGDGRPALRVAIRARPIGPVVPLAAFHIGAHPTAQIAWVVAGFEIQTPRVAPIGKRREVGDADEIDIRIRPQRIEIEVHVAAAVVGTMTIPLAPVRFVTDFDCGIQQRRHVGRQGLQALDERIARRSVADTRQPAHLRSDQKCVAGAERIFHSAGDCQNEIPIRCAM